jgi:EAL domain-containing protein (putative c-di-GMP-specific phosphodiesterase class I)/GGDEF domain-containing protein
VKLPVSTGSSPERLRTGYLKLKSVLFDRTTGLPAFPVLFDELRTLLEDRRELGVLHLELANLEMVESIYGWQVFDRVVARVAHLLREAIGEALPESALLALNGIAGDRFVCFVPDRFDGKAVDGVFLTELGRSLCRELESAFDDDAFAGLSPRLCFRGGHALLSANPFFRFERCVYHAVDEARSAHERREHLRDLSWGEELTKIIQAASIETVFQPVLHLGTRDVLGFEAFARGPRDTLFEAPRAMFALSDRIGVANELDRMCCERSLRAFCRVARNGKAFVNVLPGSLNDAEWRRDTLTPLLEELGIEPGELVFEVSERFAQADPEPFLSQLGPIRDEGFALALDDVGTGRAFTAVIEQLKPDFLKLDVSLVRNIDQSQIQRDVLVSLSALANRMDASVIAEGVESDAEAEALLECGARYAQGYLFATPSSNPKPGRRASADPEES